MTTPSDREALQIAVGQAREGMESTAHQLSAQAESLALEAREAEDRIEADPYALHALVDQLEQELRALNEAQQKLTAV